MSTDLVLIPRSTWGARYRDGFGTRPVGNLKTYLHHSVTSQLLPSATQAQEINEIRKLEDIGQARFKGGISYTFIIAPSGRVYVGHTISRIGAHTQGHNTTAAGIALLGTYTNNRPTPEQEVSIAKLLNLGVENAWWKKAALTGGHRDTKATACPGNMAYPRIPAINKLAITWAPGTKPTSPKPAGKPVLTYGSKGAHVKTLQTFLKSCNLYKGELDSSFGPATLIALTAYQRAVGLTPDGYCGPLTWAKVDKGIKPSTPKPPASGTGSTVYTVKRGDTLSGIAQRYKTTTASLVKLNGIKDANKISVGQKIKLPQSTSTPAPAKQYYTVKRGDTLSEIAQKHKTSTSSLQKLNSIKDANRINVGQKLRIK